MQVLIIRHAKAEAREDFAARGEPDELRPLTPKGRRRMRRAGRGLRGLVARIDVLAASPLRRARQTADVLADVYDEMAVTELAELAPGVAPEAVLGRIGELAGAGVVALVGHEPDVGRLASWLLTGRSQSFMPFKVGSACLIEFEGDPAAGKGRLVWSLTQSQLRALR